MKNKIKLLAVLAIASFSSSCTSDDLQAGRITEDNVWETVRDLELGLNGVYSAYSMDNVINFNAVFTDQVKRGVDNNGQAQGLYNFVIPTNEASATGIWNNRYAVINRVNRVLTGVETVEPETEEAQTAEDHITGQLLAMRALAHFDLFQYYTVDYQDPSALSIITVDYVPEIDVQLERNTVSEVLEFIYNDLDQAEALLDEDSPSGRIFIDHATVKALRARIALFVGEYDTAETLADELVAQFPLAAPQEYINVFQDESNVEVIWKLAKGQDESAIAGLFYFNNVSLSGSPYLEMSNGLFNELSPNDVRYDVLLHPTSVIVGENSINNILLIGKYPGSPSISEPLVNDLKIFRSSEMLLIRAESEARDMRLDQAAASIKQLRDIRFGSPQPLPSYENLEDALNDILEERRIELAYEGHRWLDLKRMGDDLNQGIERNPVDCASFSAPCELPRDDHRFTLPIPQTELNANQVITQNPGY